MRFLLSLLMAVLVLTSMGSCRKKKDPVPVQYGSGGMELHLEGGFAGRSEHYLITDSVLFKDTGRHFQTGQYAFNFPMPANKLSAAQGLLSEIPSKMYSENNKKYGSNAQVADGETVWVVLHGSDVTYTWTFEHGITESYAEDFYTKLRNVLSQLQQP